MKSHFAIGQRILAGIAFSVFVVSCASIQLGCASAAPKHPSGSALSKAPAPWDKPGWVMTFHDEFDGSALNTNYWIDSYPHGARTHNNGEMEYYAPDGYSINGGNLHLVATNHAQNGEQYTSGMICSYGHFAQTYGWFEMRARMPAGKGMWPAFWLLPANGVWPPEIDILEILGHEPNKVYFTNHWSAGDHQSHGVNWVGPDFSKDYHTFAVDWEPGSITWYVDGVAHGNSTSGVPAEPMFIVANLAVGGGWPGNPDATTTFPSSMDIDYIRVYRRADEAPERPFAWSGKLDSNPASAAPSSQIALR
jgi:beta-glucanase (GH16 family)